MEGSWEVLSKQLWTRAKDWFCRLAVGCGANLLQLRMSQRALNLDEFFGMTEKQKNWNVRSLQGRLMEGIGWMYFGAVILFFFLHSITSLSII
jgi:hypothetical protein